MSNISSNTEKHKLQIIFTILYWYDFMQSKIINQEKKIIDKPALLEWMPQSRKVDRPQAYIQDPQVQED